MREFQKDLLAVKVYDSRDAMGKGAGKDIHDTLVAMLAEKEVVNMIFAAAPSQNETLAALAAYKDIAWNRVRAFHMDEYIGLPVNAPQRFAKYLEDHIFSLVPFKEVYTLDYSATDKEAECKRYSDLLEKYPVDIVCLGIGENGHIAFNDPAVAEFNDPKLVKIVPLDIVCRTQQVHDGCFATLDDVPEYAITLTIPALTRGTYMFCSVPAPTKANAVREMVTSEKIDEHCPCTILRRHAHAVLYCDPDSAALI